MVETFEELWFAPVDPLCQAPDAAFEQRTSVIIEVMALSHSSGYMSFEQLLESVS